MFAPWKKRCDKLRQHTKKQRHHFADKYPYRQSYGFSSSTEVRFEPQRRLSAEELRFPICGSEEGSLESLAQEIKPVNPKGNQP